MAENRPQLRIAKRKGEIPDRLRDRQDRPQAWPGLRRLAVYCQAGAAELRPSPAEAGKKLPRILTADDFRRFYQVVDQADDVQHSLLLRLLFFTGVRVSELCRIEVADVDLENCKIFVNQGKGSKDRYVLFGRSFATALRTHIAAHPNNRWLFQTRRNSKFSTRRVQQIVKRYAEQAGREGHAAHISASGNHLADPPLLA